MSDVNEDVQRASGEIRARTESVCYYLEYSIHRDVWYRLGGIGMTLYPWALDTLRAARQPTSDAVKQIQRLYADTSASSVNWRLTKQTTITEVLDV